MFTNENNDFYFDALVVNPLICQNQWESRRGINVITDQANIFTEKYELTFSSV